MSTELTTTEELIEYKGMTCRVTKNGALQDVKTGRLVSGGTLTQYNAETARQAAQHRRDLAVKAIENGITEATKGLVALAGGGQHNWQLALEVIASKQAELAMDTDAGYASVQAFKTLLQAMGLLQSARGEQSEQPAGLKASLSVDAATLQQIATALLESRPYQDNVIDSEFIDRT